MSPLAKAIINMHTSGASVFTLGDDEHVPDWIIAMGAVIALDDGMYTTARQREIEGLLAKYVRSLEHVYAITTPGGRGGPGAAPLYGKHVPPLISLLAGRMRAKTTWYIAPTAGHAAALAQHGIDAFSVADVLHGRVFTESELSRPSAICLVYGHAFTPHTALAVLQQCPRPRVLVLAGDKLSWGGEASGLFRDVCTAISRGILPGAIERILEADAHWTSPLYAWPTPSTIATGIEVTQSPPSNDAAISLVASSAWTKSPTWFAVSQWNVIPSLGWVGMCERTEELMPTSSRTGTVTIIAGQERGLSHTHCCGGSGKNISLAAHADFKSIGAGAPVRLIAATSPYYIADEITVVIPSDATMQDVRAACTLAAKRVHFVTPGGTRLALFDAEKSFYRRPKTRLVAAIEAEPPALLELDASPIPLPPPLLPPYKLHFFGTIDATAAFQQGHVTAAQCTARFREMLGFQVRQREQEQADNAKHAWLPVVFSPISGDLAGSMTKYEIDTHVAARLEPVFTLPESADQGFMDRMTAAAGGPPRTYREREAVAIHVLCLAVKGHADAEKWLIARETQRFQDRIPTGDAPLLATKHGEAVATYLAEKIKEIPNDNPIDDDETEEFAFFHMILQTRQHIVRDLL